MSTSQLIRRRHLELLRNELQHLQSSGRLGRQEPFPAHTRFGERQSGSPSGVRITSSISGDRAADPADERFIGEEHVERPLV